MSNHTTPAQHHVVLRALSEKNVSNVIANVPAAAAIIAANTFRPNIHHLAIYEAGYPIGYTAHPRVLPPDGSFRVPAIHVAPGHDGCDLIVVDLLIDTAIAMATSANITNVELSFESVDGPHIDKYIEYCAGKFR